ncbi:helix-turn-helix domain-containing protein [Rudanella paleaurantiibacter]|uniref:helix-turn-helix domain-containing protein n=1 Tax=Rudanella lutea TaxID=451374 RepID=UPI0021D2D55C
MTLREHRVLRLAAQEMTNKEIAQALGIKEETAKCHRKNVLRKLGLRGKSDLRRLLRLLD